LSHWRPAAAMAPARPSHSSPAMPKGAIRPRGDACSAVFSIIPPVWGPSSSGGSGGTEPACAAATKALVSAMRRRNAHCIQRPRRTVRDARRSYLCQITLTETARGPWLWQLLCSADAGARWSIRPWAPTAVDARGGVTVRQRAIGGRIHRAARMDRSPIAFPFFARTRAPMPPSRRHRSSATPSIRVPAPPVRPVTPTRHVPPMSATPERTERSVFAPEAVSRVRPAEIRPSARRDSSASNRGRGINA